MTFIYGNSSTVANTLPQAPTGLSASVAGSDVTFSWDAATDAETSATGLYYNLRVGTTSGGGEIVSPMSTSSGQRCLPALGNAQQRLSWTIKGIPSGSYYWSVQAIDATWAGSAWAAEESFATELANAGEDSYGYESRGGLIYTVYFDGMQSAGADTFTWEQVAGVTVALRYAGTALPEFDAPQWDGSTELTRTQARLRFRLTINLGEVNEDSDEVEVYIRIPGDATGDDIINAFDLAKLRQQNPAANFNGDLVVNAFDLAILRQNAGRTRTVE